MTVILKRPMIAVAGSSGKTTTKEMIASILSKRWPIFKSPANQNNRRDIRKHVKKIKRHHRAVVLEFGMSARGHLTRSCHIIKPNMAVITMVGTSHIGNVGGSLTNLIRAKSELIKHMQPTGILFLNGDDANSKRLLTGSFRGRIIKVGIDGPADYQASDVAYCSNGMQFTVDLDGQPYSFRIPIYGKHNVYNALFAIAVAHTLGFGPETIRKGLMTYHRPGRRLRISHLRRNIKLIDDTFNANPNSVKAALNVLTAIGKHNNVAVLGTMSELGSYTKIGHAQVGRYAARQSNLDHLFTYGSKARLIAAAALKAGYPRHRITKAVSRDALHRHLIHSIKPGSTILVKGSNSMRMNKTVRFIKSRYS
jgi:UDP-N-acetylmuramoyl-tripeptide--D-alanyl-D-alanine ligase